MSSRYVCMAVLLITLFACRVDSALGQAAGGAGGGGGGGLTTTTVTTQQIAGVAIDAEGVLYLHKYADPGSHLSRAAVEAARVALDSDVARRSEFRKISLNRLEAAIRDKLERDLPLDDEMHALAGLTRLQYVFYLPETNDIVIAGPAEGWASDLSGRMRGIESGRPVVELRDLVVALRAFPPSGSASPVISCSIDPTQSGLANMQQFLLALRGRAVPSQTNFITNGLRKSLGMQNVTLTGISAETHFAQVLVEADFRMKLIGIGVERTPIKLAAYVDLAKPAAVAANAMQRWFFVPDYECVRVTEDQMAMELVGQGVKLIGANEMVAADGSRVASSRGDMAGKRFTEGFTSKYESIANAVPVYAQLRNCIDMAVAAAFIREQDLYGLAGWSMDLLMDENQFKVNDSPAPKKVETVVAGIWKRRTLMTPIGGGVQMQPQLALRAENLLHDENDEVAARRESVSVGDLPDGNWWWD